MTPEQLSRMDELTISLLNDLRLCRKAFETDQEFEVVKIIKERIKRIESELDELMQLQQLENK